MPYVKEICIVLGFSSNEDMGDTLGYSVVRLHVLPSFRFMVQLKYKILMWKLRGCIQKFPDWPLGARIANGTALCY
jgi:hypothetical protein